MQQEEKEVQEALIPTPASEPWLMRSVWRLFGGLLLTLLLPSTLFVFLMLTQSRHILKEQALYENSLAAQLASRAVQEHFEDMVHYVEDAALQPALLARLQEKHREGVRLHLRALVNGTQKLDRAFIADTMGVLWVDYPRGSTIVGRDFAFRDWHRGVSKTGRTYISEVYQTSTRPPHYSVAIATPIRNSQGDILAYLVAHHAIEDLTAWFAEIRPAFAGTLTLIDHQGNPVTRRGVGNEPPVSLSQEPLIQRLLAGEEVSEEAPDPITGEKSFIRTAVVRPFGWGILSSRPVDAALAPLNRMRLPFVAITVAFIAGLFVIHSLVLYTLHRYHVTKKEAEEALRKAHDELEVRVRLRTSELASANEALAQKAKAMEKLLADLTEAKKALARKAKDLARSNAELEQFTYVASHDLQDPLQKIVSLGDLLKMREEKILDDRGRECVERIQSSALRMGHLIEDLLSYCHLAAKPEPFALVALEGAVKEALGDLELKIRETRAEVHVGSLPTVYADRVQMHQLFQNLISNALKFRKKDVRPRVEIESREVNEGVTEIVVRDNGIGFEEKYHGQIFKPFERLHGQTEYQGNGVGLAICQKIVDRHGGRLAAKSAVGKGSEFIITLPTVSTPVSSETSP